MEGVALPVGLVAGLVCGVAFLYSSVGFGGASSYLAVMSLFAVPAETASTTALGLNILVAGTAFINYYRHGHFVPRLLWPFLLTSVPAAFIGGMLHVSQPLYQALLHFTLLYVGLRILLFPAVRNHNGGTIAGWVEGAPPRIWVAMLVGGGVGLLSGIVGIGGGIFLSPLILLMGWGNAKQASTSAAAFIVINSLSGLVGRALGQRLDFGLLGPVLIPSGVVGALVGSFWGARYLSHRGVERILGSLILLVVARYLVGLLF